MQSENTLLPETTALVQSELRSGERISWTGQPNPRRFARMSIVIVLFSIPWTAFAVFWMVGASAGTSHISIHGSGGGFEQIFRFFPLFGIPFVLAGFGMLTSPYWLLRKARRTAYVITNQRAIIFDPGFFRGTTIRSFEPERLHDLRRVQNSDGSGDIVFERQWTSDSEGGRRSTDIGFLAIPDVKRVEDMVRSLASRPAAPST